MKKYQKIFGKIALVLTIIFALLCIILWIKTLVQLGSDLLNDPRYDTFSKIRFFSRNIFRIITGVGLIIGSVFLLAKKAGFTKTVVVLAILHLANFSVPLFSEIVYYSSQIGNYVGFVEYLLICVFLYLFVCVSIAALIITLCQITKKEKTAKQNESMDPVDGSVKTRLKI